MRKYASVTIFTLIAGLAAFGAANRAAAGGAAIPPAVQAAIKSIDPQHIRAAVQFLSSDQLEGRGTGQGGGDVGAEYIATQFESYGLKPAGDNGTYMQKV